MIDAIGESNAVALVGLFGGILLGLAARLGRFCTLGAIEDLFYGGNANRLRMWALSIGLAVIGTFVLIGMGLLDPGRTIYFDRGWSPAASIFGGLIFGYGMALAGNCGYGALARAGGGDIRSLVIVIIMGLSASATLAGPLAPLRLALFDRHPAPAIPDSIAHKAAAAFGVSPVAVGLTIGVFLVLGALANRSFLSERSMVLASCAVALAIVSAWFGTSFIADYSFDATPVVSHTFSAPAGETILYAMTSTGNALSFGVGSVLGVVLGAAIGSVIKGHFRWEACEDPRELKRQILGAVLMGFGAIVAVGCSVGQGLSAFSVLALSAPVTFAAILAGAAFGLFQLIMGFRPIR